MTANPRLLRAQTFVEVDGLAAAIAGGLEAEWVQLESKPFAAEHVVARLADVVIQIVREDAAVARRIRVPDRTWLFLVPLAVSESARWNAHGVDDRDLFVHAPGSECYGFDPAGTVFAVITVAEHSRLAILAGSALTGHMRECTLVSRTRDAEMLRGRLDQLCAAGSHALDRDAIQRGILAALDRCLQHAMKPEPRVRESDRKRVVRRAEEFFRSHIGERVSAAQLSSAASVSERHLRNAFYDVYAISPMRYLRLWQLHQVRRALRSPIRATSVTDVATSHGFYELGRFAGEYKALFGESPSETLGRRAPLPSSAPAYSGMR